MSIPTSYKTVRDRNERCLVNQSEQNSYVKKAAESVRAYIGILTFIFPENNHMKKKLLKLDAISSKKFANIYNSVYKLKLLKMGYFTCRRYKLENIAIKKNDIEIAQKK